VNASGDRVRVALWGVIALVGIAFVLAHGCAPLGATPAAQAQDGLASPPPPCPTAGALVVYFASDGLAVGNDLVIAPDGHASLCWARTGPTAMTGRTRFVVAPATLRTLRFQLDRIDVEHLGPPPADWPPSGGGPASALFYRGTGIPYEGRPTSVTAIRALERSEAILDGIVARHAPEL
jgi:hypothetical protein